MEVHSVGEKLLGRAVSMQGKKCAVAEHNGAFRAILHRFCCGHRIVLADVEQGSGRKISAVEGGGDGGAAGGKGD